MYTFDTQTGPVTDSLTDVQSSLFHRNIVGDEPTWRVPGRDSVAALSAPKVVATRWYAGNGRPQEFDAETPADCHVVKIVLRNTNIRFEVAGRTVQDGLTTPGTVHVTGPAVVNALVLDRPVIAFDNAGVGRSTGQTPDNVAAMACDAVTFINLLGFSKVDLLGYSLGGCRSSSPNRLPARPRR